eukprot:6170318-Prymnesium_polylepis.2
MLRTTTAGRLEPPRPSAALRSDAGYFRIASASSALSSGAERRRRLPPVDGARGGERVRRTGLRGGGGELLCSVGGDRRLRSCCRTDVRVHSSSKQTAPARSAPTPRG